MARTRWPPDLEPRPLAQAGQIRPAALVGARNWDPADKPAAGQPQRRRPNRGSGRVPAPALRPKRPNLSRRTACRNRFSLSLPNIRSSAVRPTRCDTSADSPLRRAGPFPKLAWEQPPTANWDLHLYAGPSFLSWAATPSGQAFQPCHPAGRRALRPALQTGETSASGTERRRGAAMTRPGTDSPPWSMVDEGWGRKAVDFATLSEPGNCREYVAVHHRLGVDTGDRLLDVACGSGFAVELARLRGASCSGVDASARLVAVARDRNPDCDIRVGDMHALPWDPAAFDVVTSFRGIWGTTPDAVAEIHRVLRPGGRVGITVWGHLKMSPGAWALAPFRLAAAEKVGNQAVMVSLGRPGAGEQLLESHGFVDVERWKFRSPGSSRTQNCTRVRWPLPDQLMRPSRTSARLSSIARPSSRLGGSYGMACLCGPTSTSWATWPANPKERNAHDRRLS